MAFCLAQRVQRGFLEELLDSGIAHKWVAFSSPNGAPLEFYGVGMEGWVQPCLERSAQYRFEECTRTSTSMVFEATDSGKQQAAHENEITEANPNVVFWQ